MAFSQYQYFIDPVCGTKREKQIHSEVVLYNFFFFFPMHSEASTLKLVLVSANILLIQFVEQKEENKFWGDKSCKIHLTLGTLSFIFQQFEWIIIYFVIHSFNRFRCDFVNRIR